MLKQQGDSIVTPKKAKKKVKTKSLYLGGLPSTKLLKTSASAAKDLGAERYYQDEEFSLITTGLMDDLVGSSHEEQVERLLS